jgi:AbrB family looped-hinge helix DNA binding protein
MLMKVHPKGQVVIPVELRRRLGIDVGDRLEVEISADESGITLRRPARGEVRELAGSLRAFAAGRPFPSEAAVEDALRRGLAGRG